LRPSGRLLSTLLVLLLLPAAAHAFDGGAWTVSPGEWYSEVSATRAYAASRFFPDGRNGALANEGRFQQFEVTSYNELGWRKNTSFMLAIPFTSLALRDRQQSATVSGLSDFVAGIRMRLKDEKPAFVFDAGWIAPAGYNKNLSPRLGDGRHKFFGSMHAGVSLPFFPGFVQAARGFYFVTEDGELYWRTRVEAAGWIGSKVLIGLRYADQAPLSVSGGVGEFPHNYLAGATATVRVDDRMDISVGADRQFFGRNALDGTQFQVVLGFKRTKLGSMQGHLGGGLSP